LGIISRLARVYTNTKKRSHRSTAKYFGPRTALEIVDVDSFACGYKLGALFLPFVKTVFQP